MDTKTRTKRHFVLLVKHPSLLTNCKRTVDICGVFVEFLRHEVSGKPVKWKPRYRRSVKGPSLTSNRNPTYTAVSLEWKLWDIMCQENPPSGNWHTDLTLGSPRYEIWGKSMEWKATYNRKGTFLSNHIALRYHLIANEVTSFVAQQL